MVAQETVYHVVTYRLRPNGDPMGLVRSFTALVDDARLDGKPYIRSVKGGKQHSPQSLHAGMQVVFVMEFECEADRDYWVFSDPMHKQFKRVEECTGVESTMVFDFTEDKY